MASAACCPGARFRSRRGFTLLELLVAMALTMLLIVAIGQFFVYITDIIADGRAIVEMGSNIRNAVRQLRDDLNSVTVHPKPPIDESGAQGFLEIVEGIGHDYDINGNGTAELAPTVNPLLAEGVDANNDGVMDTGTMRGDIDDILTMTIRSNGQPFTANYQFFDQNSGQFQQRTVESHLAEVVWFTTYKDLSGDGDWQLDEPRFLVRRMLLVAPNIVGWRDNNNVDHFGEIVDPNADPVAALPDNVFQHNDLSLASPTFNTTLNRWVWKANSLTTLSRRENRFAHLNLRNLAQNGLLAAANYMPAPLQIQVTGANSASTMQLYTLQGVAKGEDLLLSNLLAFDVRVYDPTVPLYGDKLDVPGVGNDTAQDTDDAQASLQPGDPGFATASTTNEIAGYGAYVDLWHDRVTSLNLTTYFSDPPNTSSYPYDANGQMVAMYDTWTTFYERDGYNQDPTNDMISDEGTDGLDNDSQYGVDDAGEFETSPPYLPPLRGIQVRIRMYEPGTRQTRQATVVADFVEE